MSGAPMSIAPMSIALLQLAANPQSGVALPPHWGWWVILYFFLGGLAGGSYVIATLLQLAGEPRDEDAVRLGYLISFPLVVICGLLLIIDLGQPLRFWHMLIQSERPPLPILKSWSPISLGSWILTFFGLFSFVSFVGELVRSGRLSWGTIVRADRWARSLPRPVKLAWHVLGAFFGFALAGYTGVLVTGTSVPFWHNAQLLGALFLASAVSTSYALLTLLLLRRGRTHGDVTVEKLARADRMAIVLEMVILAAMLLLLGSVARPMIRGGFGVVFWLGVVLVGLLVPLVLTRSRAAAGTGHGGTAGGAERRAMLGAVCVLLGGFLLRFVVVMSPQWPQVPLWYL